jgi:hypothetical protein
MPQLGHLRQSGISFDFIDDEYYFWHRCFFLGMIILCGSIDIARLRACNFAISVARFAFRMRLVLHNTVHSSSSFLSP